ncbi:MAG: hypothetical protein AABW86_04535 [Candidatus Micrarchaeota archaeon]
MEVEVFARRGPDGLTRSILRAHGRVTGVTEFGDVQTDVPHDPLDRILGADKVRIKLYPDSGTERVFWVEPHDSKRTPLWPLGIPVCHNDRGLVTLGTRNGFAVEALGLRALFSNPVNVTRPQLPPLM